MRRYASFFEWPDKARKELGVVEELVKALNRDQFAGYGAPESFSPDPPDCICTNPLGEKVAFEVVEVVCEVAARMNAQGNDVFRNWVRGELTEHVSGLLAQKDSKTFHGGPYASVVVCLFTDEPLLTIDRLELELAGKLFGPYEQVDRAYLVVSYDPSTKTYPVVELNLLK
ncbi:hypothetical protein [Roseateles sp.]|uniref:hypothetical protein n=1 Tax=Roseateles sp. TaxID=1971397 RepID=UPI00286AD5EA|nr:hypothetical protein [Roseateles sp.]